MRVRCRQESFQPSSDTSCGGTRDAVNFTAIDGSGIDWSGSDEVLGLFKVARNITDTGGLTTRRSNVPNRHNRKNYSGDCLFPGTGPSDVRHISWAPKMPRI